MKYGYFDDQKKEYVITRPDTPSAWANYLGSPEYGALISNNAGGYSFVKSGAKGRILRYNFDNSDRPGRYIYIRDNADGDYWSASWQPVGKDLSVYKSECRHGLGYSRFLADCSEIHSEAVYYVPLDCAYEVWALKLRNDSGREREITVTGYAEFTNDSNYEPGATASYSGSTAIWTRWRVMRASTRRRWRSGSWLLPGRKYPPAAGTRKFSWAITIPTGTPSAFHPVIWAAR